MAKFFTLKHLTKYLIFEKCLSRMRGINPYILNKGYFRDANDTITWFGNETKRFEQVCMYFWISISYFLFLIC